MFIINFTNKKTVYERLSNDVSNDNLERSAGGTETPRSGATQFMVSSYLRKFPVIIWLIASAIVGFTIGILFADFASTSGDRDPSKAGAPRIPLPTVLREFVYSSPFSQEPPQGEGSGAVSEPIWDALVPSKS